MTKPTTRPALRLYVRETLVLGKRIELTSEQCHYVFKVMRHSTGDVIGLFNGHSGEQSARLEQTGKKTAFAHLEEQISPSLSKAQNALTLYFAPIKRAQTELIVQKATELGATELVPVITQYTQRDRSRPERLENIAIEACEQCERLEPPVIKPAITLKEVLSGSQTRGPLLVAAEAGDNRALPSVLEELGDKQSKLGILTGPEAGFSEDEFSWMRACDFAHLVSLGPRILKAETAAITALGVVQALRGDWHLRPSFRAY